MFKIYRLILVFSLFANNAFADVANQQAAPSIANLIPFILIFLVFYFLLIRPQQKKIKEHENTLNHLKVGDKVLTNGGLVGTIKAVDKKETQVDLEIASQVIVKLLKSSVVDVIRDKNVDAPKLKEK